MSNRTSLLTRTIAGAATLAMVALPMIASASPHSRMVRQQERINQGEKSGQLTKFEQGRDEARLQGIEAQRQAWMNAQGGKLTDAQKAELESELNNSSRAILFTKHNENNQPGAPDPHISKLPAPVSTTNFLGSQLQREFDRMHNGIADGTLTRAEYDSLSKQLQAIAHEREQFLIENNGKMTAAEESKLQSEIDAASKNIYGDKHNADGQPTQ